jgi:uncharacterized Zn finger protein (UPF0148 family)
MATAKEYCDRCKLPLEEWEWCGRGFCEACEDVISKAREDVISKAREEEKAAKTISVARNADGGSPFPGRCV